MYLHNNVVGFPPFPLAGKEGKIRCVFCFVLIKNQKNMNLVKFIFKTDKNNWFGKTHKIIKTIGHILKIIYECIGLAAITLVITSWSLIFLVKGSAKLWPVSTNLIVIPTWSSHFLTLSSKC